MRHGLVECGIIVLTMIVSQPILADIYRSVDKDGSVIFSDLPAKGAEKVELPPAQTYTTPASATPNTSDTNQGNTEQPQQVGHYEAVTLSGIQAKSTLPHNQPISISVSSMPALQDTDRYGVLLDSKAISKPQTTGQFTIPAAAVTRGEHRVQAVIVNQKNQILKQSDPITFFVFQRSTLLGPNKTSP